MKKAAGRKTREAQPVDNAKIAEAAYYAWERDGRPAGHDQQYWFQAEASLRGGNMAKASRSAHA